MKYLYLIPLLLLASCQQGELPQEPPLNPQTTLAAQANAPMLAPAVVYASANNECITIGEPEKFIEVYSIENMRNAFMSIFWRNTYDPTDPRISTVADMLTRMSAYDIVPTHRYVEIGVAEWERFVSLTEDSSLILRPIPVDHLISGTGTVARAPAAYDPESGEVTLTETLPLRYAIIPFNKSLPSRCSCRKLADLYIPKELDDALADHVGTKRISETLADLLTDQAMYVSGARTREDLMERKVWKPQGSVKVYDNQLGRYVGVPHVKVHIYNDADNTWIYTDNDGNFKLNTTFEGAVNYYIERQTKEFRVLNNAADQAYYYCGKTPSYTPLYLNITGGEQYGIATVWRALAAHFYGENPWDRVSDYRTFFKPFRIFYRHEHHPKYKGYCQINLADMHIAIYGLESNLTKRESESLLSTTFHELGHAGMSYRCHHNGMDFSSFKEIMYESWASFIGWFMTKAEYNTLGHNIFPKEEFNMGPGVYLYFDIPNEYNKQELTKDIYLTDIDYDANYTPLFIDLVDDSNQDLYYLLKNNNNRIDNYPNDNIVITNYALLHSIASASHNLAELKSNLLTNTAALGITAEQVHDYFSFYENK